MHSISFFSRKPVVITMITLAVAAGAYALFWPKTVPQIERYVTAPVESGTLIQAVSANGTLNPVTLVNVGTQVSGVVKKIYADFNDKVEEGKVLLELDPSLTRAQVAQSEASIAQAAASLDLARANMKRTRALYQKEYVSRQEYDAAVQALKSAEAQLTLSRAQAERDRINLNYTVIRSPVAGVIVSREVDVGQTVAASFQTPTLFKIAQDLTRMQIDSSFAEADIGAIRAGQPATFTVDAFPEREFAGTVRQLRLNPTTQQNVVTYNVVIDVKNDDFMLLPGMTAYVSVITAHREHVLKVPNAALRLRPAADVVIGSDEAVEPEAGQEGMRGTVYLPTEQGLRPVRLLLGASDSATSEVLAGALKAGDRVVIEIAGSAEAGNKRQPGVRIR
ncbi:MAG: efflux RND transporter periplasmic adaptor subunit [Zetaproteobacteria bacterium CG_4_9_14_3_um_filter_53_7]|nr:MAG: efflux RND transporter periplasmic adaptor subunit [Zetaproteobacteria bacterium CG_4_9_14_3_um_filter_53_7]